jgi:hypothetical protein
MDLNLLLRRVLRRPRRRPVQQKAVRVARVANKKRENYLYSVSVGMGVRVLPID